MLGGQPYHGGQLYLLLKLLEPTIFFNLYTKSQQKSGSKVLGVREITVHYSL